MKATIIYDSWYGHTQKIAEAIGEGLGKGFESQVIRVQEVEADQVLRDSDLLMIGSPTQGGWYTESIKSFLARLPKKSLEGKCAVSFDTSTLADNHGFVVSALTRLFGNAALRIEKELKKKGAHCFDSEVFYVVGKKGPLIHGEVERARAWAVKILKKATKHQSADPSGPVT